MGSVFCLAPRDGLKNVVQLSLRKQMTKRVQFVLEANYIEAICVVQTNLLVF